MFGASYPGSIYPGYGRFGFVSNSETIRFPLSWNPLGFLDEFKTGYRLRLPDYSNAMLRVDSAGTVRLASVTDPLGFDAGSGELSITGILDLDHGGTNKDITAVPGAVVWTDSDSFELTAAGTSGQILVSQGATSPVWQNPSTAVAHALLSATHPDTVPDNVVRGDIITGQSVTPFWTRLALGSSGKILRSNGTDLAYSTFTIPDTYAQGDLIYASATNTLTALAKDATATRYLSNTGATNNPAWAQVNLTNGVTGTLPVGSGGTGTASFTQGSVIFMGASSLSEDNTKFFWNDTENRLGIGTDTPFSSLHVVDAGAEFYAAAIYQTNVAGYGLLVDMPTASAFPFLKLSFDNEDSSVLEVVYGITRFYTILTWPNDNTYDIGYSGRPRDLLLGRNAEIGGNATITSGFYTLVTSPAQITADQNNYAIGAGTFFRLTSDASRTITGLTGGTDGKHLIIVNVGSFNIILANQSASSTAANRIITGTGADITLLPDERVEATYDDTTDRWRCGAKVYTGSGSATHNLLSATHPDTAAASPVRGDILIANSTPAWSKLAIGTTGKFLKTDGNDPSWQSISVTDIGSGAALTKTDDTNVTLTLGGTPSTALLAATSLTLGWTGQLSVPRGGTGASSYTAGQILYGNGTSAIASSAALVWDEATRKLTIGYGGCFLDDTDDIGVLRVTGALDASHGVAMNMVLNDVTYFYGYGGTVTGAGSTVMFDTGTTWNTSGTPTGWNLVVVDTASNAASLLMKLSIGASTRFSVRKDGRAMVGSASSATGSLAFAHASSAHLTTFQAGNASAAVTYTLPTADGTGGYVLSTNGSGVLSWAAPGSGAPSDAQYVVMALSGSLSAERVLTGTTNQVTITDGGANGNATLSLPQDIHTSATPQFLRMGLGTAAVSGAVLKLDGGSSTIAPLLFSSDTKQSSAVAGSMEYDGTLWFTKSNAVRYSVGGTLFHHHDDVNVTDTTETDLWNDSIPANTLDVNGHSIHAVYTINFTHNPGNQKRFKVKFGGTTIFDSDWQTTTAAGSVVIRVTIMRDSSTSIDYGTTFISKNLSGVHLAEGGSLGSLTLSNSNTLIVTGQAGASTEITGKLAYVRFDPAA